MKELYAVAIWEDVYGQYNSFLMEFDRSKKDIDEYCLELAADLLLEYIDDDELTEAEIDNYIGYEWHLITDTYVLPFSDLEEYWVNFPTKFIDECCKSE